MINSSKEDKEMFQQVSEIAAKWGPATLAALLGHRDTSMIKNWLKRKKIPFAHRVAVKAILERQEVTINLKDKNH